METVLISGGSGLIGKHLSRELKGRGYKVVILSRKSFQGQDYASVPWDPDKGKLLPEAVAMADYIIHLAGAGIGDKRWTTRRKREIVGSRVKSGQLLLDAVKASSRKPKAFISSSAVGYYGAVTSDHIFEESDPPAKDFLGETCRQWEETACLFEREGIRTVIIRTGVVLTQKGGALEKMAGLTRYGLGSPLGSGRQYIPWIHVEDLCEIYIRAMEDTKWRGAYNAAAPDHRTNSEFYRSLAAAFDKPLWLPHVPAFVLKLLFGEMSGVLLMGSRISSGKIRTEGFRFRFPKLEEALNDLLKRS